MCRWFREPAGLSPVKEQRTTKPLLKGVREGDTLKPREVVLRNCIWRNEGTYARMVCAPYVICESSPGTTGAVRSVASRRSVHEMSRSALLCLQLVFWRDRCLKRDLKCIRISGTCPDVEEHPLCS